MHIQKLKIGGGTCEGKDAGYRECHDWHAHIQYNMTLLPALMGLYLYCSSRKRLQKISHLGSLDPLDLRQSSEGPVEDG